MERLPIPRQWPETGMYVRRVQAYIRRISFRSPGIFNIFVTARRTNPIPEEKQYPNPDILRTTDTFEKPVSTSIRKTDRIYPLKNQRVSNPLEKLSLS